MAAIIFATGVSDQFTQDIEDMQKELLNDDENCGNEQRNRQSQKENPQNDQQRQQVIKKIMASIKKSCGNDAKKVTDTLKALFPKKGINDCTPEDLIEAQKILDAQSNAKPTQKSQTENPLPWVDDSKWPDANLPPPTDEQARTNGSNLIINPIMGSGTGRQGG